MTAAGRGRAVPAVAAVTAGPADADALSHVIADAFHDLPPSRWLIADPGERARIFPGFFRILVDWGPGRRRRHHHPRPGRRRAVDSGRGPAAQPAAGLPGPHRRRRRPLGQP
ncbi:MAG TPA: hypothetical protein VK599_10040, partial [Streptosporangiaceae bacterium]|nr:hypothetical protein [Streptosporangiaceae bacterium]